MSTPTTRQPTNILVTLALCMALQMTGFVMILPLFPRRFESFGAGVEALGVSAMLYALTSMVAAPFIGMLADRFGRRPIILVSLAGYILAFSGYLFATNAWLLIMLRGLAGVFTAGLLPAVNGMVGDLAPDYQRGRWIGIVNGGAAVGWILGPLLGGALYDGFGYRLPFAVSIAMAIAALLLAATLIPESRPPADLSSKQRPGRSHGLRTLSFQPLFLLLLLITFGAMFAWAFIEPQFMFYAYDDLSWTSSQLGLVMSAFGLAFMLGAFTLGHLSDRLGRKPVLVLGLVLFSAQFIGLVVFRNASWIVVSFVIAGLGNALYDPALGALLLDITPHDHTAGMMGLKSTAGSLGNMLGPALVVLITPWISPQGVFLIAAALVLALTLLAGSALRLPKKSEVGDHLSEVTV